MILSACSYLGILTISWAESCYSICLQLLRDSNRQLSWTMWVYLPSPTEGFYQLSLFKRFYLSALRDPNRQLHHVILPSSPHWGILAVYLSNMNLSACRYWGILEAELNQVIISACSYWGFMTAELSLSTCFYWIILDSISIDGRYEVYVSVIYLLSFLLGSSIGGRIYLQLTGTRLIYYYVTAN